VSEPEKLFAQQEKKSYFAPSGFYSRLCVKLLLALLISRKGAKKDERREEDSRVE
jgi:hypothetical protein